MHWCLIWPFHSLILVFFVLYALSINIFGDLILIFLSFHLRSILVGLFVLGLVHLGLFTFSSYLSLFFLSFSWFFFIAPCRCTKKRLSFFCLGPQALEPFFLHHWWSSYSLSHFSITHGDFLWEVLRETHWA